MLSAILGLQMRAAVLAKERNLLSGRSRCPKFGQDATLRTCKTGTLAGFEKLETSSPHYCRRDSCVFEHLLIKFPVQQNPEHSPKEPSWLAIWL
jgi:hypothetical protein